MTGESEAQLENSEVLPMLTLNVVSSVAVTDLIPLYVTRREEVLLEIGDLA